MGMAARGRLLGGRGRSLVVLLALVAVGLAADVAHAARCQPGTVRDYAAPLSKLRPVSTIVWPDTDLPFGPGGLELIKKSELQRGHPVLVPGGAHVSTRPLGYDLVNGTGERSGALKLGWSVRAELARLPNRKHPIRVKSKEVGTLVREGRKSFRFAIPQAPGNYLLAIQFRSRNGTMIGRLGEYFRVLAPRIEAQITLSSVSMQSGDTLDACLENFGTASLFYGEGVRIEEFDGAGWGKAAISPSGAVTLIGLGVGAGERRPLGSFTVPSGAAPGRYRYAWNADSPALTLASEFQIQPSP